MCGIVSEGCSARLSDAVEEGRGPGRTGEEVSRGYLTVAIFELGSRRPWRTGEMRCVEMKAFLSPTLSCVSMYEMQ